MLNKILIANRGEIACRIARTARRLGVGTVAVYSDADAGAVHTRMADVAVHIGPSPATESYLKGDTIIAVAKATGSDGIHPGYGFLSENADFAEAVAKAGLKFIGPSASAMRALGGKAAAKDIAIKAGVPVVPGYQGARQDAATLAAEARKIGYPIMIKAVAGGGGRGMRLVEKEADLPELLASAQREAASAFGNPLVLIEKVVQRPRHIEVQVFGDQHGQVVHLFERDCTLQRRNQKVVEEAPAPGMSPELRERMCAAALQLAKAVGYEGAGTVEFLVEGGQSSLAPSVAHPQPAQLGPEAKWYFIEMNTRLQVEHPVTEEITGLDLVEWQLRIASGEPLPLVQDKITMSGHAIEVRLCAEDPSKGFLPSIGRIGVVRQLDDDASFRLESGIEPGSSISPFYDSMIAKIIGHGADRDAAMTRARHGLQSYLIGGLRTNAAFLDRLLGDAEVVANRMDTGFIARHIDRLTVFTLDHADLEESVFYLLQDRTYHGLDPVQHADRFEGPWVTFDAFGLGPQRRQSYTLDVDGLPHKFDVTWDQRRGPVLSAPGPRRSRTLPLRMQTAAAAERIFAIQDLTHIEVSWPTYDASGTDDGADGSSVRAPINGKVARIFVAEGEAIEKGARVAVVEAMKMEHVLHAAKAGKVVRIAAREGQQVTQGTVIVALAE